MKRIALAAVLVAGGLIWGGAASWGNSPQSPAAASQTSGLSDRGLTQNVRKALMADKSLSTYAHNVKILTHDGKVTLRGVVRSEDEKKAVADAASAVVGGDNVTNDLTIQPSK